MRAALLVSGEEEGEGREVIGAMEGDRCGEAAGTLIEEGQEDADDEDGGKRERVHVDEREQQRAEANAGFDTEALPEDSVGEAAEEDLFGNRADNADNQSHEQQR